MGRGHFFRVFVLPADLETPMSITTRESAELEAANASGRRPIVFVHGLWLLPSSWDPWRQVFEEAGYATLAPGWPDDPETVADARAHPEVFAGKKVQAVTDHHQEVIRALTVAPALVGHSFGGLIVQKLAGLGIAEATVSIDPAPGRGVLPLPLSALRSAFPVLGNPANASRSVTLTLEQFRYGWANALDEDEATRLYDEFHVAASGAPIFQAAFGNVNPRSETRVDYTARDRGPLLVISGGSDNTVPHAIAHAAYRKHAKNAAVSEFAEIPGRGHSLVIDSGWREVAEKALEFVRRFAPAAKS
jgi:pimeloyl-ACP methyl ester carboxylesterase